jgi:hypothetical protein
MTGRAAAAAAALWSLAACSAVGCMEWGSRDDSTWSQAPGGRTVRVAIRSDPVTVAPGEVVQGDLVVVGGAARVDGTVAGDLVVIDGSLRVGPTAVVGRDLIAVGNETTEIAPGVQVGRSHVAVNFPGVRWMVENALFVWDNPLVVLLGALLGIAFLLWLAYRVLIRPYDAARMHGTIEHHPVRAGLFGLIVHVAFSALAVGAFASRWGIGLALPIALGGFLLGVIGWVMCAVHVGRLIAYKRGWTVGPFTYGLAGFGLVGLASCVPILGQLLALLLSLVGVGALIVPAKPEELPAAPAAPPPARASVFPARPPFPSGPEEPVESLEISDVPADDEVEKPK